jgi:hypothetical protein
MYLDFVSCTFTPYPFIFHWQFYSYFRDDAPIRARRNPKRKSAVVSKPNEPARGCMPVRQYHTKDESKILPHVRLFGFRLALIGASSLKYE